MSEAHCRICGGDHRDKAQLRIEELEAEVFRLGIEGNELLKRNAAAYERAEQAEAEVEQYHAEGMVPANAWAHDLERLKQAEARLAEAQDKLAGLLMSSCSLCQENRRRANQAEARLARVVRAGRALLNSCGFAALRHAGYEGRVTDLRDALAAAQGTPADDDKVRLGELKAIVAAARDASPEPK